MNCQIRGVTSIRKGQRKDHIPFLLNTDSIIASENVSGGVQVENQGSLGKVILKNPEGSQSGGVQIFPNSEGSQYGGVSILPIWRGPILSTEPGGVIFLFKNLGKQKKR